MKYSEKELIQALSRIRHPENGKDLVELGIIEKLSVEGERIELVLKFKKQNDPFTGSIRKACEKALRIITGKDSAINISVAPPDPVTISPETPDENPLKGVKNIIAVASGKGGVGKSTIAVNLAVAMAKNGSNVGLIDADVYGPSIPKMFSLESEHPYVIKKGNKEMIIPVEKHGVKILSLGFFVRPEDAVIWRGPMATGALKQLIFQSDWGDLDYLFIDLPPGTGDIHLTMVQEVAVTGVVIVSTPQEVALADARKGIAMFTGDKINVPVLGLIENMAWFTPAELPENKYYIFGKDGCKKLADEMGIELLGQVPVTESVCRDGDIGRPSVLDENNPAGRELVRIANRLVIAVEKRNKYLDPTRKVQINN